jgi:hypothetical protein
MPMAVPTTTMTKKRPPKTAAGETALTPVDVSFRGSDGERGDCWWPVQMLGVERFGFASAARSSGLVHGRSY